MCRLQDFGLIDQQTKGEGETFPHGKRVVFMRNKYCMEQTSRRNDALIPCGDSNIQTFIPIIVSYLITHLIVYAFLKIPLQVPLHQQARSCLLPTDSMTLNAGQGGSFPDTFCPFSPLSCIGFNKQPNFILHR